MSQNVDLAGWLNWQQRLHPNTIDLGLERVRLVWQRLGLEQPSYPVVTVGGTNGKGSCVALLDSILSAAGYRVGTFTSPHLIRYNERIRIAGCEISDASLVAAFERIDAAREGISLTFFEFNALAALLVFSTAGLDALILEVGMGGRLDAVNIIDADVAIVSSVALDHCEWLGKDIETIGREKAGIFRSARPAIFGARAMPQSIATEAAHCGAALLRLGQDFDHSIDPAAASWDWRGQQLSFVGLPPPALLGRVQFDNAATVLAAVECLHSRLPLNRAAIERGLRSVRLAGRFQIARRDADRGVDWILDVAHNPAAAQTLAANLAAREHRGRTIAVCGILADKDIGGVIAALRESIDIWIVAGVDGPRALSAQGLADAVRQAGVEVTHTASDVRYACEFARGTARSGDRIVVFGSFHTVGPALEWLTASDV